MIGKSTRGRREPGVSDGEVSKIETDGGEEVSQKVCCVTGVDYRPSIV